MKEPTDTATAKYPNATERILNNGKKSKAKVSIPLYKMKANVRDKI